MASSSLHEVTPSNEDSESCVALREAGVVVRGSCQSFGDSSGETIELEVTVRDLCLGGIRTAYFGGF